MQPDELRQFLRTHGLWLDTDKGQHFLLDDTILQAIIFAAELTKKDHVVEIGPGIGILTKELIQHAGQVTAVEIDQRLIPLLEEFVGPEKPGAVSGEHSAQSSALTAHSSQLTVVQGDALQFRLPDTPYKVVANIPYYITSPLLRHIFVESERQPLSATLLIQREVAENICGEGDSGILTILVGLFGTPRIVTLVPPEAFLPPPKVESAVLHIDCFKKPKTDTETMNRIFGLTKSAFSQKRKMLRNSIGHLPGGAEAMKAMGIAETRRPQTLTVDEWIGLAKEISKTA